MIEPFEIPSFADDIEELHRRLATTRWPLGAVGDGGLPLAEAQQLVAYWRDEFDWDLQRRRMAERSHFRTSIDGLGVHFIHERSTNPAAMPLLLLHGWPGSFVEMLPIIPLLRDSFHVVVPSMPGYGFSEAAREPGMTNERIAAMFASLMAVLGYERFGVQGGDWGAGVGTWLARREPQRVIGLHLNYIPGSYTPAAGDLTVEEQQFLRDRDGWLDASGAYGHVQRTRPLTLAYGLSDSPAGLAGWIAEKCREWEDPETPVSIDNMLTNITLYWLTNTINASMRLYLESMKTPLRFAAGERISVPCGIAHFPREEPFPPRSWIERIYDVRHWTDLPRGGHFAAWEVPDLMANDLAIFFAGCEGSSAASR